MENGQSVAGSGRFFGGLIGLRMDRFPVARNRSVKSSGTTGNASEAVFVGPIMTIGQVLGHGRNPQVGPTIIKPVTVFVIYLMGGGAIEYHAVHIDEHLPFFLAIPNRSTGGQVDAALKFSGENLPVILKNRWGILVINKRDVALGERNLRCHGDTPENPQEASSLNGPPGESGVSKEQSEVRLITLDGASDRPAFGVAGQWGEWMGRIMRRLSRAACDRKRSASTSSGKPDAPRDESPCSYQTNVATPGGAIPDALPVPD